MACRFFVLLAVAGASDVLLQDDECQNGLHENCALNALQRRAQEVEEDDNEPFLTEADTKEPQNVSMEDLGIDELQRLLGMAQDELAKRGEILGAAPELPDDDSSDDDDLSHRGRSDAFNSSAEAKAKVATESQGCGRPNYYGNSPKELCFCKLAKNPGCASKRCTCPQGCGSNVVWQSAGSVTFKNRARAHGCRPSTVLLTAPKAFYGTPGDLKQCSDALAVIEMLLRDSWNMYQTRVHRGSMNQCFHGSRTASVKYLHMQSFCSYASFHAMPNNNHAVGVCVKMRSANEASTLARKLYDQMQ